MAHTAKDTTLDFGLVSAPVKLKNAVTSDRSDSFKLASANGEPVKQVYIVEETGEVVGPRNLCQRGVFDADGFHPVSDEAIKQIDEEVGVESITIDGFISLDEVPFERVENTYFLAPGGKGTAAVKPLALLRDGLKHFGRAGYGRVTLSSKTYPFVVTSREVEDGQFGLVLTTLRYAERMGALVESAEVIAGVETDEGTLALAGTLMDQIGGSRELLDSFADDRTEKRAELVALAVAGKSIPVTAKTEKSAPAGDLSDLLLASITAAAGDPKKKTAKPKSSKAAAAA